MSDDDIEVDIKRFHRPGRYAVTRGGYVFDRYPFRWFSVIFILLAVVIVTVSYFEGTAVQAWAYCPDDAIGGRCDNLLYGKCDLPACEPEFLWAGQEIGEKPSATIVERYTYGMLGFLALLFLLNHLAQNTERYNNARNSHNKPKRKRKPSTRKKPTRNKRS